MVIKGHCRRNFSLNVGFLVFFQTEKWYMGVRNFQNFHAAVFVIKYHSPTQDVKTMHQNAKAEAVLTEN